MSELDRTLEKYRALQKLCYKLEAENAKLREQVNRLQRQSELMKTTLIELKLHASRAIGDMINSTLAEVQELDNA